MFCFLSSASFVFATSELKENRAELHSPQSTTFDIRPAFPQAFLSHADKPDDVVIKIMEFLPWEEAMKCRGVSRQFNRSLPLAVSITKNINRAKITSLSRLHHITTLDIGSNNIGDEGARYLSTLQNLHTLSISWDRLDYNALANIENIFMEEISGSSFQKEKKRNQDFDINENGNVTRISAGGAYYLSLLTSLHTLHINEHNLGDEGARHISSLANLRILSIRRNNLKAGGARYISLLTNLCTLDIGNDLLGDPDIPDNTGVNNIGAEGARHLSLLINLHTLDIGDNNIGDEGASYLGGLANLHTLKIRNNQLGDEGVRHLISLLNLHSLDISVNNLGAEGALHLSILQNLQCLDISGFSFRASNNIGDEGARHFSKLVNLRTLGLSNNGIRREGVYHISSLVNLQDLNLDGNEIGDEGAYHLSSLVKLQRLNVDSSGIGDEGVLHLSNLVNLQKLSLRNNPIGGAVARSPAELYFDDCCGVDWEED
jgi:Ran GTPase-activating protein (RanGAP) involved in mRNA processing and transport